MRSEADKLARFPGDAQTKDINSNPTAAALKFVYGISMVKHDYDNPKADGTSTPGFEMMTVSRRRACF